MSGSSASETNAGMTFWSHHPQMFPLHNPFRVTKETANPFISTNSGFSTAISAGSEDKIKKPAVTLPADGSKEFLMKTTFISSRRWSSTTAAQSGPKLLHV